MNGFKEKAGRTLYQLSGSAYDNAVLDLAGVSIRSIRARVKFEALVASEGYLFSDSYEYAGVDIKVGLICPNGHDWLVKPSLLSSGSRCPKCPSRKIIEARKKFETAVKKRGYELVDGSEYVNCETKVKLKCPVGHVYETKPTAFSNAGNGCRICSGLDPETAKLEFEKQVVDAGFGFADDYEYVKSSSKVWLTCPDGHRFDIKPVRFKQGFRCKVCSGNSPEHSRQEFEELLLMEGYRKQDSYCYSGSKVGVDIECPEGHRITMIPSVFKRGYRCSWCSNRSAEKAREEFELALGESEYTYVDGSNYQGADNKVSLSCPVGHTFELWPSELKRGNGCPICSGRRSQQLVKFEFFDTIERIGYRLADGECFVSGESKLVLVCDNGHEWKTTANSVRRGSTCVKCSNNCQSQAKSNFEEEVLRRGYSFHQDYEYCRSRDLVKLICPVGHECSVTPSLFIEGSGCKACNGTCPEHAKEAFEQMVADRGYKFADDYEYKGSSSKVLLICPEGHSYHVVPSCFKSGDGCSVCNPGGYVEGSRGALYLLLSIDNGVIKVGISNRHLDRIRALKRSTPWDFDVLEVFEFDDGRIPKFLESKYLNIFKRAGFRGFDGATEWCCFDGLIVEDLRKEAISLQPLSK